MIQRLPTQLATRGSNAAAFRARRAVRNLLLHSCDGGGVHGRGAGGDARRDVDRVQRLARARRMQRWRRLRIADDDHQDIHVVDQPGAGRVVRRRRHGRGRAVGGHPARGIPGDGPRARKCCRTAFPTFTSGSCARHAARRRAPARDCGVATPDAFLRLESCGRIPNLLPAASWTRLRASPTSARRRARPRSPWRPCATSLRSHRRLAGVIPAAHGGVAGRFIAGQDLASDATVAELTALLRAQKPDPSSSVMVSVMVPGDCPPSREPTPHWIELAQAFGGGGLLAASVRRPREVCSRRAPEDPIWALQPPCLSGVLDLDSSAPGVQAECTFQETTIAPDGTRVTTALPACEVAAPPCWRLEESAIAMCTAAILVDHDADWCQETLTTTRVECLVAKN